MSFKRRPIIPKTYKSGDDLAYDLIAIGFRLSGASASKAPNLEETLVAASIDGLINHEPRVMSLLTDWITFHFDRVIVDRLYKMVNELKGKEFSMVRLYWCANTQRLSLDQRTGTRKLRELYSGARRNLLSALEGKPNSGDDGTDLLIRKNGEDGRFSKTCLRVPLGYFRNRPRDVLTPRQLAKTHSYYRYRVMLGSTFRADMWAALSKNANLSASELAWKSFGNYVTARQTKAEYEIIKRNYASRGSD